MSKTAQQVFCEAAALIETRGWCQDVYARNANGRSVYWDDPDAAVFCMAGAIRRCATTTNLTSMEGWPGFDNLTPTGEKMGEWNDHPTRTADEVIAQLRILGGCDSE
jgi:hypothetical protein